MLTPLPNAPKPPMHDPFAPSVEPVPEQRKKKKKKKKWMSGGTQGAEKGEREVSGNLIFFFKKQGV